MEVIFENVSADYQLAFIRSPLVLKSVDLPLPQDPLRLSSDIQALVSPVY